MSLTTVRSLETASKSSMDVQNLNNLVSSFRIPVKKSKVDAIHKLTAAKQKLQNRRGSPEQEETNKKKAERLLEEISIVKKLNLDKVVKFALGNTFTLNQVSSKFKNDIEMKAMVRISLQKPLQSRVTKWRKEHSDWSDLSAFISQHTGRRFKLKESSSTKDKETKPKFKHQQRQINSKLSAKVAKESVEQEADDSSYHSEGSTASDQGSQPTEPSQMDEQSVEPPADRLNSSECRDEPVSTPAKQSKRKAESSISNVSVKKQKTDDALTPKDTQSKADAGSSGAQTDVKQQVSKNVKQQGSESASMTSRDMVVTKLNLDDLPEVPGNAKISFIFKAPTQKNASPDSQQPKRKKTKSSFFMTGDEAEDDGTTQPSDVAEVDDDDDDLDEGTFFDAKRVLHESTFMGSLAGAASKFKDYAGYRIDKRRQKKEQFAAKAFEGQGRKTFNAVFARDKTSNTASRKPSQPKPEAKAVEVNLHPSWEASKKKKMQAVIPTFEGKKKTFDD